MNNIDHIVKMILLLILISILFVVNVEKPEVQIYLKCKYINKQSILQQYKLQNINTLWSFKFKKHTTNKIVQRKNFEEIQKKMFYTEFLNDTEC